MSALSLTKPIGNPFKRAEKAVVDPQPQVATAPLGLGGVPRANLLPPSVLLAQKGRRVARRVIIAFALAAAVAVFATGLAGVAAGVSSAMLATERAETDQLIAAQAEFSDVSAAQAAIERLTAARATVGATDVDWAAYLGEVRGTLPDGVGLTGVTISATTPTSAVTAGDGTAAAFAATLLLTVTGPDLPSIEAWIDRLATLPSYAGATLSSVTQSDAGYQAVATLAVDETIYSGIYTEEAAQ